MSDIQNFKIQKGVLKKYIGNETEIAVPDGVTEIKAYAFFECLCAESVIIPEGVIKKRTQKAPHRMLLKLHSRAIKRYIEYNSAYPTKSRI